MFLTMCHGTWNALSELSALKLFLHNWREDNFWLHTIGGWTIGVLTIAHVWSLLLPSIFHGYANRAIPGMIDYPAQVRTSQYPTPQTSGVVLETDHSSSDRQALYHDGISICLSESCVRSLASLTEIDSLEGTPFSSRLAIPCPNLLVPGAPDVVLELSARSWCDMSRS